MSVSDAQNVVNAATWDATAARWGFVAKTLIEYRDGLRYLASDDCGRLDSPEQRACYERAAKSLGPAISEAVKNRQAFRDSQQPPPLPPYEPHPDNMTELVAELDRSKDARRARRDREGCCGEKPTADGYCFGIGKCPRFEEAQRCASFLQSYFDWLDQIDNESALAAAVARLCVSSPLTSEVSNV